MKSIFLLLIPLYMFLAACERKNAHRYTATEDCNNLSLSVRDLKRGDNIYLLYDTRLLLRQRVEAKDTNLVTFTFCNKYRQKGVIRFIVKSGKTAIIDTSITVWKPYAGFLLAASRDERTFSLKPDTVTSL